MVGFKGWLEKRRKKKALGDWEDEYGLDFVKLEFQLAQVQLKTAKEKKQLNRNIIERKGKDDYVS